MDWIRQYWPWLTALAAFILAYVHMRTRRSRPGCRDLTGVECAVDDARWGQEGHPAQR